MISIVKNLIVPTVLTLLLFSCNQGQTLQHYYVEKQEQPNFLSIDAPMSMLNLDESQLSQDQKDAYNSIKKLNMLAYKMKPEQQQEFETELEKVKTILSDSKYEELMRGGDSEIGQFSIKVLGDDDDVQEFILFGSSDEKGFAIVRVLGKDMNPGKIMSLVSAFEKVNIDDSQIGQFIEFFK